MNLKISSYVAVWALIGLAFIAVGIAINWNLFIVGSYLILAFLGITIIVFLNPLFFVLKGTISCFKFIEAKLSYWDKLFKKITIELKNEKEEPDN